MNRRDMLHAAVGAGLACVPGTEVQAAALDKESSTLALVITLPDTVELSEDQAARISEKVKKVIGPACPPVLVVPAGVSVNVVRHPVPFTFHEKLGDYEYSVSFQTHAELEAFLKDQWYRNRKAGVKA